MRIVFVRHGEPNYEKDCLTETGHKQARLAAERLKEEGIEELWSSPYGRARQTAEAASDALGLPVKILDFMHELDWGSTDGEPIPFDGHPWNIVDEMARQGIDLASAEWRSNPFFARNRVVGSVENVEKGIDEWLADFGYIRRGYYYEHTIEEENQRTVALFSHGGSSCAAIGHIMNMPFPFMCAMLHIEYTGITVVRMDKSAGPGTLPCLELANDGKHIREGYYHRLSQK